MSKHIVIDARLMRSSTGRYVERLIHYLQEIDTTNRYTVLLEQKDYDDWQPTNPSFHKVACPFPPFSFGEQVGLARQLRSLKPDLVHFSMVQQPILYHGRVVTTMHDLTTVRYKNPAVNPVIFTVKQWAYMLVNIVAAHKSVAVITPSEYVRQDVASFAHVDPRKITVTYEAVDDFAAASEPINNLQGVPFIAADGRARPHKNLGRIIEAFAATHQKHPEMRLLLIGKQDATFSPFLARITALGLEDAIIQAGYISDGQLKWALQNCTAYLYASLSEGFGLIPLEAMQSGAPVILSNATCLPEICGPAAEYFDPRDTQSLVEAIERVVTSEARRKELVGLGRKQIAQYSWRRMAEQTLAIYEHALGSD